MQLKAVVSLAWGFFFTSLPLQGQTINEMHHKSGNRTCRIKVKHGKCKIKMKNRHHSYYGFAAGCDPALLAACGIKQVPPPPVQSSCDIPADPCGQPIPQQEPPQGPQQDPQQGGGKSY